MTLETAYANGQLAALTHYKLGFIQPTHPVVQESGVLRAKAVTPVTPKPTTLTPPELKRNFDTREQEESRTEPLRKLSADLCTTCRKERHYGSCKRPVAIKRSNFNQEMHGEDQTSNAAPTSPNYSAITTAFDALIPSTSKDITQAWSAFDRNARASTDVEIGS